jgi:hypothetical protein
VLVRVRGATGCSVVVIHTCIIHIYVYRFR